MIVDWCASEQKPQIAELKTPLPSGLYVEDIGRNRWLTQMGGKAKQAVSHRTSQNIMNETESTYAKLGPTGAFDPNANGDHQFLTPFAVPSWERRFAIDWNTTDVSALVTGLHLALTMRSVPLNSTSLNIYRLHQRRSELGVAGTTNRFQILGIKPEATQLSVQEAAENLHAWLHLEALYPPKPWFEGGEARGFQMFDVPFRAHPRELYGTLVVEPKWFEIHK